MKRKRLTREGWGFQGFPYAQIRVDAADFHGTVCLMYLLSGENCCWKLPKAGRVAVCGQGMSWMTLIPDGARSILTAKYRPDGRIALWYADMVAAVDADADGVLAFTDAYLDVIFTPQGDIKLDDLDELRTARKQGELTRRQYMRMRLEGWRVTLRYALHPRRTEAWCSRIRQEAERRPQAGRGAVHPPARGTSALKNFPGDACFAVRPSFYHQRR